MSAPSRRPFQGVGGRSARGGGGMEYGGASTTLRSTVDHGADDAAPPPPRSSNATGTATRPMDNDLVLGFDHRMTTEERRRMRQEEAGHPSSSRGGPSTPMSSSSGGSRPLDRTPAGVGRSSSSYGRYGDSPSGVVSGKKMRSPRISSSSSVRSKSTSISEDDTFRTPTITPGKGIPEEASVRYGNRESYGGRLASSSTRSRSSDAPRTLGGGDDRMETGTAYSRGTYKTSNRSGASGKEQRYGISRSDDDFAATTRDRKERYGLSSRSDEDFGAATDKRERKERYLSSRSDEDFGATEKRERRRRSDNKDADDVASTRSGVRKERRKSSSDILSKESRRRAKSRDEAMTPEQKERRMLREKSRREKVRDETSASPSVKSSLKKSSRSERLPGDALSPRSKGERKELREKFRDDAGSPRKSERKDKDARSVSTRSKASKKHRAKSRDKGREESRRSVVSPGEIDERKRPPPAPPPENEGTPRTPQISSPGLGVESPSSSAQISARNRLRERMMGDMEGSSSSSRDRVKSSLSLDTPRMRKKVDPIPTVREDRVTEVEKKTRTPDPPAPERRSSYRSQPKADGRPKKRKSTKESSSRVKAEPVVGTSSDDDDLDDSLGSTDSSGGESNEEQWSVRVCVLSAVDLPSSIVPNIPLCPVFKFGLVTTPASEDGGENAGGTSASETQLSVLSEIEKSGLTQIPKSRVRCTSTKILSKRDNGAVEFHEEMRWDKVKRPLRTALAVELCARAVLPPTNADESPVIDVDEQSSPGQLSPDGLGSPQSKHRRQERRDAQAAGGSEKPGFGMGFRSKSVSAASTTAPSDDSSTASGIAGMRALWRKGRQQFTEQRQKGAGASGQNEMEAATAAAAVARFLVGGSSADNNEPNDADRDSFGDDSESIPAYQKGRLLEGPIGGNVALVKPPDRKKRRVELSEDLRLRSLVVPLTRLPLEKATSGGEAARIEQWYQMDGSNTSDSSLHWQDSQRGPSLQRRNPSILLEITFSPPGVLDKEDETANQGEDGGFGGGNSSISRGLGQIPEDSDVDPSSMGGLASPSPKTPDAKPEDPVLEPGVVDFICVVGARDIGNQRNDNGAKGWVNSTPDYTVLERFPRNDEFHIDNGRMTALPDKIEWFCFPEGCKLWRGVHPPTHNDLNLKRFSASSPPNVASSMAVFDTCLNCTTSFTWWVLSSTSEDYGSKNKKTYGACIRFYAPAPPGIDPTQDDFAQSFLAGETVKRRPGSTAKRLWVPLGICLVSSLPIVGVMESMLLRICEQLSSRAGSLHHAAPQAVVSILHQDLANLIVNFQCPVPGVLHCSIPFLQGERLHLTLPPVAGLPPLPHGASVTMVCRLLGAEGLNVLLAAVLTECKILIHSDDIANLAMVAEVLTSLIYPFEWALPYIPVLPDAMMEFIEAPLSYLLGMPTSSLKLIDPAVLSDVVVVDLDNGFSSPDYFDGRRAGKSTKVPTALPASVASNISKAVFRLLREEEEVEEQYGAISFPGSRSMPRLESESLAEREFRIAVALQICGLVRGYQECLIFVSASQPVFNRDRFLRNAPALFEDRRGNLPAFANPVDGSSGPMGGSQRMLSPRSKRFLSLLVNTQHFHGLLERLDNDDIAFFHEVMDTFDMSDDQAEMQASAGVLSGYGSSKLELAASHLTKTLQKVEDKIPTYRVDRKGKRNRRSAGDWDEDDGGHKAFENFLDGNESVCFVNDTVAAPFTNDLLQQIFANESKSRGDDDSQSSGESGGGVHSLSIEYMVKLEKNPWRYRKCFEIPMGEEEKSDPKEQKSNRPKIKPAVATEVREKVKLRDAIGERRYRAWKVAQEQKHDSGDESTVLTTVVDKGDEGQNALDLTSLLMSAADAMKDSSPVSSASPFASFSTKRAASGLSAKEQRVADAKDRDVLRRCLEQAYEGARRSSRSSRKSSSDSQVDNGRDLVSEAETALRNPSAQMFLISVLSQRSRIEEGKKKSFGHEDTMKASRHHRQTNQSSVSRLQPVAFECLVRLCCAMLGACLEEKDYEPAYRLLTQTAGFCTIRSKDGGDKPFSPVKESDDSDNVKIMFMTARIGLHPIFADLRLWETVMALHLQDRQNEKGATRSGNNSGVSTPTDSLSGSGTSNKVPSDLAGSMNNAKDSREAAEYEAAVATLYEMLGFGIPAEELARFAGRVSEKYGWFSTERGHSFLMLARRLSVRRDEVEDGAGSTGDLDILGAGGSRTGGDGMGTKNRRQAVGGGVVEGKVEWSQVGWCHPAAEVSRPLVLQDEALASKSGSPRPRRSGGYESLGASGDDEGADSNDGAAPGRRGDSGSKPMSRTPVTAIASFGSNVVASGGIDGSVFVAHTINFGFDDDGHEKESVVRGVRLIVDDSDSQKGSDSSPMDGDGGVGAISCLAAAKGAGYRHGHVLRSDQSDEEELLSTLEGCRVVAGTTGGNLQVWSVKDVYAATALSDESGSESLASSFSDLRFNHGSAREGLSSSYPVGKVGASERKLALKGRALSGHRGGVSCMDVPSHVYRPDSLVTGGVDGLIKLWSLRKQSAGSRRNSGEAPSPPGRMFGRNSNLGSPGVDLSQGRGKEGSDGSDALGVLTGHGGRVMCVRAAWHGDRLISGGADKTVRVWDVAGSGGKCLNTLSGHAGWVTQAHYWGPHTVVSASTDRSVALWDVRTQSSPLFVLRYHRSPITDLLVGSRTDPLMVSAAGDGTVATWDFRSLSGKNGSSKEKKPSTMVRQPLATMSHCAESKSVKCSGGVLLSRGPTSQTGSAITVGVDAAMKEWDIASGRLMRQEGTGHCDIVSTLTTFTDSPRRLGGTVDTSGDGSSTFGGIITSSWDGTVRMRRLIGIDN